MRTALVVTNETCNHRCGFCTARREHERAAVAAFAAVLARIDAHAGVPELVLTGGEPTLRRDLPRLIAAAARRAGRVVLETNGSFAPERARAFAAAGLALARVHVPGLAGHASTTGVPDDRARLIAAVAALHEAGVEVEAVVPIVAATLAELEALPAAIRRALPAVTVLWARVPHDAPAGAAATLAEPRAAIDGLERLAEAARTAGLRLQLDPATVVPPCLLRRPDRLAHAYALGPGAPPRADRLRVAACDDCVLADRCPTVAPSWLPHARVHARAIADERLRRRLSVVESVPKQIERELVTDELWRRSDGRTVAARVVRIGFACNQACEFCFVSTHLPAPAHDAVAAAVDDIAARGGVLVLSGGEPTLVPELPQWIARGKAGGAAEVELQTNATRLDDALVARLVAAGLDSAFVSLHGATATTSDRVTAAPGTFVRTCSGLDALARASALRLRINFVLCGLNFAEFPAFVELVAQRWPRAAITVSFVAPSSDLVPRTVAMVPRYRDVAPALTAGLARARAHGIEVGGFDSMCGIPWCLLPPGERERQPGGGLGLAELPPGIDRGEFVKADACGVCVLERRCFGLRRGYAELHGTDELVPCTDPVAPALR
ncbi:MAG: radical SAM protein [Nannocystaceae bacterium]|nr:radical SAM protein [Nannocystaceae bacterium]